MRGLGLGLLGFFIGATGGFVLAFALLAIWYDVLGLGQRGADGLSGVATFMLLGPLLTLGGGIAGALLMTRKPRDPDGSPRTDTVIAVAFAAFALLGAVVLFGMV